METVVEEASRRPLYARHHVAITQDDGSPSKVLPPSDGDKTSPPSSTRLFDGHFLHELAPAPNAAELEEEGRATRPRTGGIHERRHQNLHTEKTATISQRRVQPASNHVIGIVREPPEQIASELFGRRTGCRSRRHQPAAAWFPANSSKTGGRNRTTTPRATIHTAQQTPSNSSEELSSN